MDLVKFDKICRDISNLLNKNFGITIDTNSEEDLNEELLGIKFRLRGRDLVYLLFDIEKEFNIKISEEDIAAGKFNTIHNIAKIVYDTVNSSNFNGYNAMVK